MEAEEACGPDDRINILRRTKLAEILLKEGLVRDAEGHFKYILRWSEKTHGEVSRHTLKARLQLAENLVAQDRPIEAMIRQCVILWHCQTRLGPHHPLTLECLRCYTNSLALGGFFEGSIIHCKESLVKHRAVYGAEHQMTRLAALWLRQVREVLASMPLFFRLRAIQTRLHTSKVALGEKHWTAPWLAEWELMHIDPLLTAEGTEVRVDMKYSETDEGWITRFKLLDEAVTTQPRRWNQSCRRVFKDSSTRAGISPFESRVHWKNCDSHVRTIHSFTP